MASLFFFAAEGQSALSTPNVKSLVVRGAVRGSEGLEIIPQALAHIYHHICNDSQDTSRILHARSTDSPCALPASHYRFMFPSDALQRSSPAAPSGAPTATSLSRTPTTPHATMESAPGTSAAMPSAGATRAPTDTSPTPGRSTMSAPSRAARMTCAACEAKTRMHVDTYH